MDKTRKLRHSWLVSKYISHALYRYDNNNNNNYTQTVLPVNARAPTRRYHGMRARARVVAMTGLIRDYRGRGHRSRGLAGGAAAAAAAGQGRGGVVWCFRYSSWRCGGGGRNPRVYKRTTPPPVFPQLLRRPLVGRRRDPLRRRRNRRRVRIIRYRRDGGWKLSRLLFFSRFLRHPVGSVLSPTSCRPRLPTVVFCDAPEPHESLEWWPQCGPAAPPCPCRCWCRCWRWLVTGWSPPTT